MSAIASKRVADPKRVISAREVALQVVRDVFGDQPRAARESLDYRTRTANLSPRDRGFATELAYGAIKMRRAIDYTLAPYLGARAATLPKPIAEILRLGTYQLRHMNGVEAYAAVSESVGLARRYGHKGTAGLVNAVLRKIAVDEPRGVEGDDDDAQAARGSLPTWIVAHWHARFGAERTAEIVRGVNAPAAIGLCVDFRRGTRDEAIAALQAASHAVHPSPYALDAIVLDGAGASSDLDALANERWDMHAEAACFPVDILDLRGGETVFEACSGRGNKTLQIVSRMRDEGQIESVDLDERRVARARERLSAAGATSVTMSVGDAAIAEGQANCDRVLVDAPCSGLGIVGRQPEARWRKDPADGARLAPLQRSILDASSGRLRPGGMLVYSVCSTDTREGEAVVDGFLADHPAFARAPIAGRYAPFLTAAGDVLVAPGIEGRDGFYIARVTRTA
ncbi:MAG: 16S rRNA (cytosine(967)-C(5))-methyltransferase RsmB [Candidatus Velthaea sp.]